MTTRRTPIGHDPDRISWDVVAEHLDEAEFLFERWRRTLDAPHYTLTELRNGPELRLLAHVDGLRVGGELVVRELLEPVLADETSEPLRAAAVALTILTSPDPAPGRALVARLPSLAEPVQTGVAWALAACDRPDLAGPLAAVLAEGTRTALVLDVAAARGDDPKAAVDELLRADDPTLRVALARACGVDRRRMPWIERAIMASDAALRDAALPVGLVMGSELAWQLVGRLAQDRSLVHREAMTWLAQLGDARATDALIGRLSDGSARADVLWALGFSGRVAAADACVRWLADDAVGAIAGEAFAGITGIDPREDAYWEDAAPPADVDELPPLAEDLEQPLALPLDAELRPPKPEAIARWWAEHRERFAPEHRYFVGQPAQHGNLLHALQTESMRRRHARAFELLVRTRGQARVPTRVLGDAQARALEACAALAHVDGNRPFGRM